MLKATTLALTLLCASGAAAHEFWLEPLEYRVAPGEEIRARAYNGEFFEGIEFTYAPGPFRETYLVSGETRLQITGEPLARPAIAVTAETEGLNILMHASPVMTLEYEDMERFARFLEHQRLDKALEDHRALGLPTEEIREAYFRFVKALVAVGSGAGEDRALGLPYELVALDNPYTAEGDIRVRLLLMGAPAAGAPVYVFHRQADTVETIELTTDSAGMVTVPGGPGEYLVNAVHITPPNDRIRQATQAHWVTLWAALNYQIER